MVGMIRILRPGHSFSTVSFADEEEKTSKQHNGQLSGICVEAMQEKQAVIHIDGGKGVEE